MIGARTSEPDHPVASHVLPNAIFWEAAVQKVADFIGVID
jgi:hypothetical protein